MTAGDVDVHGTVVDDGVDLVGALPLAGGLPFAGDAVVIIGLGRTVGDGEVVIGIHVAVEQHVEGDLLRADDVLDAVAVRVGDPRVHHEGVDGGHVGGLRQVGLVGDGAVGDVIIGINNYVLDHVFIVGAPVDIRHRQIKALRCHHLEPLRWTFQIVQDCTTGPRANI